MLKKRKHVPAGIRTQDLLKTSQSLLPLSHRDCRVRPRNVSVCESISIYGYIGHISTTPMPESLWLSGKSVWLVFRRSCDRIPAGTCFLFLNSLFGCTCFFLTFSCTISNPLALLSVFAFCWTLFSWLGKLFCFCLLNKHSFCVCLRFCLFIGNPFAGCL